MHFINEINKRNYKITQIKGSKFNCDLLYLSNKFLNTNLCKFDKNKSKDEIDQADIIIYDYKNLLGSDESY